MNLLTGAGTVVENRLFATLDSLVRRCERGGREPFLLIDTVGFIRKLPHHLVASFRSTLEEAADADLLLHIVDASSPALDDHLTTTRATMEQLGLGEHPCLLVFNKIDEVAETVLRRLRSDYAGAVFISALDRSHADDLEKAVRHALVVRPATAPLDVPSNGTFAPPHPGRELRARKSAGAVGRRPRRVNSRPASRRSGEGAGGGRIS
jgi:GTP-binding protein HflX